MNDLFKITGDHTVVILSTDRVAVYSLYTYLSSLKLKEKIYSTHFCDHEPKWNLDRSICNQEKKARRGFYEHDNAIHVTTVDCAQGHTFRNVIFLLPRNNVYKEVIFTGLSRATDFLRVIDASPSKELYKSFSRMVK